MGTDPPLDTPRLGTPRLDRRGFPRRRRRGGPALAALAALALAVGGGTPAASAEQPRWSSPVGAGVVLARGFSPPPQRWAAGHRGVDLLGESGAPVRAAGDGVVTVAGQVAGRPVVAVQHGSLRTTYLPVVPRVRVGDRVSRGDVLGSLSTLGNHCAPRPCLHWGLRRGEEYLDPLRLLGRGPARLLPVWAGSSPPERPTPIGRPSPETDTSGPVRAASSTPVAMSTPAAPRAAGSEGKGADLRGGAVVAGSAAGLTAAWMGGAALRRRLGSR